MSMVGIPLLLLLLLAHMLGDFVLQSSAWIDERYEKRLYSKRLYAHVAIHGALSLLVLCLLLPPAWQLLGFAAIIATTHFAFDLAKSYTTPGRISWFIVDQLLHLAVIALVWLAVTEQWPLLDRAVESVLDTRVLLILIGYFVVIWPFAIVIGLVCSPWARDIDGLESLANAGKRIGQLERFLVLTFILVDQFAAIGFLLAAKSILRFGDTREKNHRKINEYILVGTMTSFSLTIAFGLLLRVLAESL
ncbi:MAG: DUF3307 domain-containing protein [Pseudomonadota bacterium]